MNLFLRIILIVLFSLTIQELTAEEEKPAYEFIDPNYTRLFLSPTAETLQKGSAYVGVTEFLLFQYAYGLTDSDQIGVTVFPILPSAAFIFKKKLINEINNILSFQFGLGFPLIFTKDFSGIGLLGGLILSNGNREKRFTISSSVAGAIGNSSNNIVLLMLSLGYETRTSERVKWLFELNLVPAFTNGEFREEFPRGFTFGPRFFGKNFAADLGFLFPLQSLNDVYIIIPVFNFAYHF